MIAHSIAFVPLCEALAVGCFGLVKHLCRHSTTYNIGRGGAVCGHFHVAYLLSALLALPFMPPSVRAFSCFNGGTHLCCYGKLSRGLVQVFLTTPFHGGKVA